LGEASAGNYTLTAPTLTADITAKALTVGTPTVTLSKVYDGTLAAAVTAASLSGVASGDAVSVTASGLYGTASVGTGKTVTVTYTLGGADAGNYAAPGSQAFTTGAITAKGLTVSGLAAASRAYDGTTTATVSGTPVLSGVASGDTVTVVGTATGAFANKNVGTGRTVTVAGLSLGGVSAGNYTLTAPTLAADITAVVLRVVANHQQKAYDGTVFVGFTARLEGFVAGETSAIVTGAVGFGGNAVAAVDVGLYTIMPLVSGMSAPNYVFGAEAGQLQILDSPLANRLVGFSGGVGLATVTDAGGLYSLEATMGEAVVGGVSGGGDWTLLAGFWSELEGGVDGVSGSASLAGHLGLGVGVEVSGEEGHSAGKTASWRRLEFGWEGGNRLALPTSDAGLVPLEAAGVSVGPTHERARLGARGLRGDGSMVMDAVGAAGTHWLIQARTDLMQGEWRTLNWIQLDGDGHGVIEVTAKEGDGVLLLRLIEWVR
jgi:hypothetical protein